MIYLNAGNLWTDEFLDKVIELNNKHLGSVKVSSLFGSIANLTPTARAFDRIPYLGWSDIDRYVRKAKENDISIRYTLNSSCLGSMQEFKNVWDNNLKTIIRELHEIGIREWTITSPLVMELMSEMFPKDFLEISTIAEVKTPSELQYWIDIGAKGANLSTSVNRDFRLLSDMASMTEITLLANEACLYNCPWRRDCYNLSSHNSQRSEKLFNHYPFSFCNGVRLDSPEEWLKSRMILPQWLNYYREVVNINRFKITFRTHPYEVAVPILEAYMNLDFDGNLCDLWPTIAKLGNTAEPHDSTYISTRKMDAKQFLIKHWSTGDPCRTLMCGEECTYCHTMYDECKGRD